MRKKNVINLHHQFIKNTELHGQITLDEAVKILSRKGLISPINEDGVITHYFETAKMREIPKREFKNVLLNILKGVNVKYLFIFACFLLVSCATAEKPKGFEMPVALRETLRGGETKGLENASSSDLGMPSQYELVPHTCTSTPIFHLDGTFLRTEVRCW